MTAVLDTSFLLALTNTKDRNHGPVLNIARTISDPLILPISILPEVCYLIASRLGHPARASIHVELDKSDNIEGGR